MRLFKIIVAEHPRSEEGDRPSGTDELIEVTAYSMLLRDGDFVFSTDAGLELRRVPSSRVRSIDIVTLEQPKVTHVIRLSKEQLKAAEKALEESEDWSGPKTKPVKKPTKKPTKKASKPVAKKKAKKGPAQRKK